MSLVHHSRGLEPSTAVPGWRFRDVHICHMSISYGLISNPIHSKEMLHWGLGMSKGGREWDLLITFTLYQALGLDVHHVPLNLGNFVIIRRWVGRTYNAPGTDHHFACVVSSIATPGIIALILQMRKAGFPEG